jgi:anthranilate phosphoribosyltransferase
MIVLNAGAALYAADHATVSKRAWLAHDALHTGLAREKLEELGAFTAVFKVENEG